MAKNKTIFLFIKKVLFYVLNSKTTMENIDAKWKKIEFENLIEKNRIIYGARNFNEVGQQKKRSWCIFSR